MIKIGITGNIAAGKSEVERILLNMGYRVFDLDKICHYLIGEDIDVQNKIKNLFGTLNRKEIGKVVFSDKVKKKQLENIIYPKLKVKMQSLFDQGKYNIVFISGALIYEAGFAPMFDRIIYVDAPYEMRLQRLMKRNNYTTEEAKQRLDSQKENFKNKMRADFMIKNTGTTFELRQKLVRILNTLK